MSENSEENKTVVNDEVMMDTKNHAPLTCLQSRRRHTESQTGKMLSILERLRASNAKLARSQRELDQLRIMAASAIVLPSMMCLSPGRHWIPNTPSPSISVPDRESSSSETISSKPRHECLFENGLVRVQTETPNCPDETIESLRNAEQMKTDTLYSSALATVTGSVNRSSDFSSQLRTMRSNLMRTSGKDVRVLAMRMRSGLIKFCTATPRPIPTVTVSTAADYAKEESPRVEETPVSGLDSLPEIASALPSAEELERERESEIVRRLTRDCRALDLNERRSVARFKLNQERRFPDTET